MRYSRITLEDFDNLLLNSHKGWQRNRCGYEWVYDRVLVDYPNVMIKILSSINIEALGARNKGSDCIRVFAVEIERVEQDDVKIIKVKKGLVKARRVLRVGGWKENLRDAYIDVFNEVKDIMWRRKRSSQQTNF